MGTVEVDTTDYQFKTALSRKNLAEVKEILGRGKLCGRSIVCYLKEEGYSEIALFFERDLKQRFSLALASGNIQVAFEAACELKEEQYFQRLAQTAVTLGNYDISEKCLQQIKAFDKLNFFYATTGSQNKLQRMQSVAGALDDPMLRFNTSVFTGDITERIQTLVSAGQLPLAYMAARAHNLTDMIEYLEQELMDSDQFDQMQIMDEAEKYVSRSKALVPLRPLWADDSKNHYSQWPMVNLRAKEAERAAQMFQKQKGLDEKQADNAFFDSDFSSSNKEVASILDKETAGPEQQDLTAAAAVNLDEADWGNDDLDIDDELMAEAEQIQTEETGGMESDIFVPPSPGPDPL